MSSHPFAQPVLLARLGSWIRWHRRSVAVALAGFGLLLIAHDLRPAPAPTTAVVVADHDLAAGASLGAGDVRLARLPASAVPDGALRAPPTGRVLALPVRRGEVVTDVRVLGPGLLDALGGERVAAPVHLADAATAALLRVGDTVDVLGAATSGGGSFAARDALVLVTPPPHSTSAFGGAGGATDQEGIVVLAVSEDEALALARAAALDRLSFVIHPGPVAVR